MATARPFAYNTGSTISATTQIGDLAIGTNDLPVSEGYGGFVEILKYLLVSKLPIL